MTTVGAMEKGGTNAACPCIPARHVQPRVRTNLCLLSISRKLGFCILRPRFICYGATLESCTLR